MSKKTIEPKIYTEWELNTRVEQMITAAHNELAHNERANGKRYYETFGEWKKANPNNPVAKKNYPNDEYVMVISAFKTYFDKRCGLPIIDDDDELL